jgi:uncharacterized membrane protein YkvA (DUF1232 family)
MSQPEVNSAESAADPFPMQRFGMLVRRLPAYARLAWSLGRDQRLGAGRRAAVVGAAAYLVSPIDLVPGIIPVAGQLDDAAVALLGLRFALRGLPPAERRLQLEAAGLSAGDMDHDLKTVRLGAGWILRRGGRIGRRAGRGILHGARAGARAAVERLR